MAEKLSLLEEEWTRQPPPGTGINWKNPITRGLYDAWLPQMLPFSSVLGRRPTVSAPVSLSAGARGIAASAISGSVRYDIGGLFQTAPHAFLVVAEIRSVSNTTSIVRQNGALIPAQIAGSNLRAVPWSPLDTGRLFYVTTPPLPFIDVFIVNRPSVSTFELWRAGGGLVSSTGSLSGYGSTSDPLCFLGTETNGELATASVAGFLGGVAFGRGLSVPEICSLLANPWQIFEPEQIPLFTPVTTGSVSLAIQEVLHGHSVDSLSFSLDTYLAAQDAIHSHVAENLTLDASTSVNLTLSESFHGLSSDDVSLVTGSYLQVADALHGHSADVLTLATASFLAVADALHAHAADNLTLDTSNATPLTLQDATHAHSADNTVLTLDTWLAIVEAVHAHSADNVSISATELLAIADALHTLVSDALVLSIPSPPGTCPSVEEIVAAIFAAAQITPIHADIRKVNAVTVDGTGAPGDTWGPV